MATQQSTNTAPAVYTEKDIKRFDSAANCQTWLDENNLFGRPHACNSNGNWGKWMAIQFGREGVFALVSPDVMVHLSEW